MSDDLKQTEKIVSELLPYPGQKVAELKSSARRHILDNLVSLLDQAYRKSRTKKKTDSREQQKWFTIFGYLAQVSTRIVRDLEYENLRSELDELKRQVLTKDVTSLRGAVITSRHGTGEESERQGDAQRDSH
jgi:hypothetical protein